MKSEKTSTDVVSTLELSHTTLITMFNTLPIGVILVDKQGAIQYINSRIQQLFKFDEAELIGRPVSVLIPENSRKSHDQKLSQFMSNPSQRAMSGGRVLSGLTKDNQDITIEIGLSPVTIDGVNYVLASVLDTSNEVLKVTAYNDQLTGLVNRALFSELSENLRHLAIRHKSRLTIMFIDLDGFKAVNDAHGHDIGDKTLCEVADILRYSTRKNDIIARIGGDEFLACFYEIESDEDTENIAKSILGKIGGLKKIDGCPIDITASIGICSTQQPEYTTIAAMIKLADRLMYKAKHAGKGQFVVRQF